MKLLHVSQWIYLRDKCHPSHVRNVKVLDRFIDLLKKGGKNQHFLIVKASPDAHISAIKLVNCQCAKVSEHKVKLSTELMKLKDVLRAKLKQFFFFNRHLSVTQQDKYSTLIPGENDFKAVVGLPFKMW